MNDNEHKSVALQIPRSWIISGAIVLATGGAAGGWSVKSEIAVHEARQDDRIARNMQASVRNGKTIRNIAILLVRQGRHVEVMVHAVAKGEPVPKRPPGLDAIETKILSGADD